MVLRPPENTRSGSSLIGGIEWISTARSERIGNSVRRTSSCHQTKRSLTPLLDEAEV